MEYRASHRARRCLPLTRFHAAVTGGSSHVLPSDVGAVLLGLHGRRPCRCRATCVRCVPRRCALTETAQATSAHCAKQGRRGRRCWHARPPGTPAPQPVGCQAWASACRQTCEMQARLDREPQLGRRAGRGSTPAVQHPFSRRAAQQLRRETPTPACIHAHTSLPAPFPSRTWPSSTCATGLRRNSPLRGGWSLLLGHGCLRAARWRHQSGLKRYQAASRPSNHAYHLFERGKIDQLPHGHQLTYPVPLR